MIDNRYPDVPLHLRIQHPGRNEPSRSNIGVPNTEPAWKKWRDEWLPFIREERANGRTWRSLAEELKVTGKTLQIRLGEAEEEVRT